MSTPAATARPKTHGVSSASEKTPTAATAGDAGEVHCLTRDASGLIQISGRIFGSGGRNDAGQDFAATIDTESRPQRFSDVRLGAPGTIAPCSGGAADFHPVTRGGYESSSPENH